MMSREMNDLFFTCSLIEKVARETNNKFSYVYNKMGEENVRHIFEYADVFHCENMDKVTDEVIEDNNIEKGTYDKLTRCEYKIP